MGGTIQSEFARLANDNKEFGQLYKDAQEDAKKHRAEKEAKKLQKQEQLAREEAQRKLKKEKDLMASNFCYGFLYKPMGDYSMSYCVILASSQSEAEKKAWDFLKTEQKKHNSDPHDWEDLRNVFISVSKLDLSSGMTEIGNYIE